MKIKEVPSEVFNAGLDKWIKFSMGYDVKGGVINDCAYCNIFPGDCSKCPLTKHAWGCADDVCCNGLWQQFRWEYSVCGLSFRAQKIADKIVDFIIARCVYEED